MYKMELWGAVCISGSHREQFVLERGGGGGAKEVIPGGNLLEKKGTQWELCGRGRMGFTLSKRGTDGAWRQLYGRERNMGVTLYERMGSIGQTVCVRAHGEHSVKKGAISSSLSSSMQERGPKGASCERKRDHEKCTDVYGGLWAAC